MSYLTFSSLGSSGGMCSQLQSYASLLAVAKANNKQILETKEIKLELSGVSIEIEESKESLLAAIKLLESRLDLFRV